MNVKLQQEVTMLLLYAQGLIGDRHEQFSHLKSASKEALVEIRRSSKHPLVLKNVNAELKRRG